MSITNTTSPKEDAMFTSVSSRSASMYQRVSVETSVSSATPHQLVNMLYEALTQAVISARAALERGDIAGKGRQIGRAVRMIEEGLRPALNLEKGGDLAANLNGVYGYCVMRLTEANLKNDAAALSDVTSVLEPIVSAWKEIGDQVNTPAQQMN